MTTYTTAQRHEIYKKALDNAENGINNEYGLCYLFKWSLNIEIYKQWRIEQIERAQFPELWLFIETCILPFEYFDRWQVRKIILEFCIEISKPL